MKELILLIAPIILAFVTGHTENNITIDAMLKNAGQEYVTLNYQPRLRGILSYEGYKASGAEIDKKGRFKLKAGSITNGAEYYLDFDRKIIRLILFNDDKLKLEANLDNLKESLFVTGRGAGKVNVMHLPQFETKFIDTQLSLNDFVAKNDSTIASRLILLEAINSNNPEAPAILSTPNKLKLQRIIRETPLTEKEYHFLKSTVEIQRYLISDYISATSETSDYAHDTIAMESPIFSAFSREEYSKIDNLNHYCFGNAVEQILRFEYIKGKAGSNSNLAYQDWNKTVLWEEYSLWSKQYLKDNFTTEVHDKYFADILNWQACMGNFDSSLNEYLNESATNRNYLKRLGNFKNLIENGLGNTKYNLDNTDLVLDKEAFDRILLKHKGEKVLYIFWSAQFAGASVINNLPTINYLKNEHGLTIINICVDHLQFKNLWAARIIDNDWRGSHYFMPIEHNTNTLQIFGDKNVGSFCSGGAAYVLIDKSGAISNLLSVNKILSKG